MTYKEKYAERLQRDEKRALYKFLALAILTVMEIAGGIFTFNCEAELISGILFTLATVQMFIGSEYYSED